MLRYALLHVVSGGAQHERWGNKPYDNLKMSTGPRLKCQQNLSCSGGGSFFKFPYNKGSRLCPPGIMIYFYLEGWKTVNYFKKMIGCAWFVICFFLYNVQVYGTILIEGNAGKDASESFTFPLGPHAVGRNSFYVGADPSGSGASGEYGLSLLLNGEHSFLPLTFKVITLNGKQVDPNPLFDKKIKHMAVRRISHIVEVTDEFI